MKSNQSHQAHERVNIQKLGHYCPFCAHDPASPSQEQLYFFDKKYQNNQYLIFMQMPAKFNCNYKKNTQNKMIIEPQIPSGFQSSKFLDIEQVQHRFPEAFRGINIPVTLLHNHSHCPANYVLVYVKDFKEAIYMAKSEAEHSYYPCSWFLEDGQVIAYEFCDQALDYDSQKITDDLKTIEKLGFNNYGTTVRPLTENLCELETEKGHIYVPLTGLEQGTNYSETVTNGKKVGWCFFVCVSLNGRHGGIHR